MEGAISLVLISNNNDKCYVSAYYGARLFSFSIHDDSAKWTFEGNNL